MRDTWNRQINSATGKMFIADISNNVAYITHSAADKDQKLCVSYCSYTVLFELKGYVYLSSFAVTYM